MLSAVITLYFFGLLLLLFSDFLGLSFFRFRKASIFMGPFLGYLVVISTYAIVKSNFNSVAYFVVLWIVGYFFIIKKEKPTSLISRGDYLKRIAVISSLWTLLFGLKFSFFWNLEYDCPNLLFIDNEFYMKVAEGYQLSGHENAMGLKNVLFPFLNFAQPYRMNDFWLVSLGLDATGFDTIFIWELFYSPILLFICSLSLFELLKSKYNPYWSLGLSVIFLFAFSGQWYRDLTDLLYPNHAGGFDPIGVAAYMKLALVFAMLFQFFYKYGKGHQREAIYSLVLIPILVQSAIAFFVLVFLILLFHLYQEKKFSGEFLKKHLPIVGFFILLFVGFVLFYKWNQQKEQLYVGYTNLSLSNNNSLLALALQFVKKSVLLLLSYYWLTILLAGLLLSTTTSLTRKLRLELFLFMMFCYFCSVLIYANYNKIGDSYQFATNVFGPFIVSLVLYLGIQIPISSIRGKLQLGFLMVISCCGMFELVGGDNFFHSTSRIQYFDKGFINEVKKELSQLDYPLGIAVYGKDLQQNYKEDYPQYDAAFLKLFGRYHDVFSIEADSLTIDALHDYNQKINLSIRKNAFHIWLRYSKNKRGAHYKPSREDFYEAYPFSFCVSKVGLESLPVFIQSDVVRTIKDEKSKNYFYVLKRGEK
jgi:putative Mn2+ efflux pump MntP